MQHSAPEHITGHNGAWIWNGERLVYQGEWVSDLCIRPTSAFKGNWRPNEPKKRSARQKEIEKFLRQKKQITKLSKKSQRALLTSCEWLYESAQWKQLTAKDIQKTFWFKLNFITLTIPSRTGIIHSRKEIETSLRECDRLNSKEIPFCEQWKRAQNLVDEKTFQKCLNNWLTKMKTYHGLGNYVWKLEAQQNGQLHIHILSDHFLHYKLIRDSWNDTLQTNGLLDNFFCKFGHYNPNSTDVHSIKKGINTMMYIGGYMKKDPHLSIHFKGRIWGSSHTLSRNKKCSIQLKEHEFNRFKSDIICKKIEFAEVMSKAGEDGISKKLGVIFYPRNQKWAEVLSGEVKQAYNNHINFIRSKTKLMPKEYYQFNLFEQFPDLVTPELPAEPDVSSVSEIPIFVPNQLKIFSNDEL